MTRNRTWPVYDGYGGSFDNRMRLVREVVAAVGAKWPERLPLMIRLSATDWVDGGWNVDETIELCSTFRGFGVLGRSPTPAQAEVDLHDDVAEQLK